MDTFLKTEQDCRKYEAELLWSLVRNPDKLAFNASVSDDMMFYGDTLKKMFQASIDNRSVMSVLANSGIAMPISPRTNIPNIVSDVQVSAERQRLYTMFSHGLNRLESGEEPDLIHNDILGSLSMQSQEKGTSLMDAQEFLTTIYEEYRDTKANAPKGMMGPSTGLQELDDVIHGLQKGHIIILGGYSGVGKSSAAVQMMASVIADKKRALFISLEMTTPDIYSRLIGNMTDISSYDIVTKKMFVDMPRISKEIGDSGSNVADITNIKNPTLMNIITFIHTQHAQKPIDVIFIDYIQLIEVVGKDSDYSSMKKVALTLQATAKNLGICIVALSQISNEGARENNDQIMSYKGAGDIGATADVALEVKLDCKIEEKEAFQAMGQPYPIKWVMKKHRHGIAKTIKTDFNGRRYLEKDTDFNLF